MMFILVLLWLNVSGAIEFVSHFIDSFLAHNDDFVHFRHISLACPQMLLAWPHSQLKCKGEP